MTLEEIFCKNEKFFDIFGNRLRVIKKIGETIIIHEFEKNSASLKRKLEELKKENPEYERSNAYLESGKRENLKTGEVDYSVNFYVIE